MNYKPAFQTYAFNEMSDENKSDWTDQMWGWYFRIKCHMWSQANHQGKCLSIDSKLAVVCRRPKNFDKKAWQEVLSFFRVEGKFLVDPELLKQLKNLKTYSEKQSDRANKRWKKPAQPAKAAQGKNGSAAGEYLPEAGPPGKSADPRPAGPAHPDKIEYKGKLFFPSELLALIKQVEQQISQNETKLDNLNVEKAQKWQDQAFRTMYGLVKAELKQLRNDKKALLAALNPQNSPDNSPEKPALKPENKPDNSEFLKPGEIEFSRQSPFDLQKHLAEVTDHLASLTGPASDARNRIHFDEHGNLRPSAAKAKAFYEKRQDALLKALKGEGKP